MDVDTAVLMVCSFYTKLDITRGFVTNVSVPTVGFDSRISRTAVRHLTTRPLQPATAANIRGSFDK